MMQPRSYYPQAADLIDQIEQGIENLEDTFNISIRIASITSLQVQAYDYLEKGKRLEKRWFKEDAASAFKQAIAYMRKYEIAVHRNVAKENLEYARRRLEQASKYENVDYSEMLYYKAIDHFKQGRQLESNGFHQHCIHAYYKAAEIADAASEQIRGSRFSDEGMKYFFMLIMLLFPILLLLAVLQ